MSISALSAVVLAAGEEGRMRSLRPKPLHLLCGRPMLGHVLGALPDDEVGSAVVVVSAGAERIAKRMADDPFPFAVDLVERRASRGTGDLALAGLEQLTDEFDGDVVILPGDTPMLHTETVATLVEHHRGSHAAATLLTIATPPDRGVGLVERGRDGRVERVSSGDRPVFGDDDAQPSDPAIAQIVERPSIVSCFRRTALEPALRRLAALDPVRPFFLLDAVEVIASAGHRIESVTIAGLDEVRSVGDRIELAEAEAELRERTNRAWMGAGVTMVDPERTYVDATVQLASDVTLFPNTMLSGRTVVGARAELGPDTRLVDCSVGEGARIEKVAGRDAEVGPGAEVGPFVVLEPGAQVAPGERVPPFTTVRSSG